MKNKLLFLLALCGAFYLGTFLKIPVNNEEVVDLSQFTTYYEKDLVDNGGWNVETDNYYVFKKDYTLTGKIDASETEEDENTIPIKSEYIVKKGDTLSEIAEDNGISLGILLANNHGISAKTLKIGQKLVIFKGNGIFYKVEKGDTLNKIASLFNVDVENIKTINKISDSNLKAGTELYIKNPRVNRYLSIVKLDSSIDDEEFIMPIKYTGVSSPQGQRYHPVLKRYIYHSGVDLGARFIPTYASKDGRVSFAGVQSGYGKIIIIKHSGGYETRYAHLDKIGVKVGQFVKTGELIGKTGQSGRVTGPHLHFEIRKNGRILNPMKYLKRK